MCRRYNTWLEQIFIEKGVRKKNTHDKKIIKEPIVLCTPWNQIEAGILFGLKLPLIIFKEKTIEGGIFDLGTSDLYVHTMPEARHNKDELRHIILKWYGEVNQKYAQY